ncbi:hypothetical protein KDD30_18950 (plasmid) [Photobacterium sp. GJ3]|uniref:hypothetical protein n=1 Tax=Photobacterium sp. GJ3 TaxID=2829502 RepID=UPI001B8BEDBD|nr:hypothetical protein [Photobacterium sp. GJ3]QUJ70205.1 hypothetical protein KDD30_18950 [Photobacterium sp. GJ3]
MNHVKGPYGAHRAKGLKGQSLLPDLTACVDDVLAQGACSAESIDLIVSLSLSPDHLVAKTNVMGPRIGHPLQREIGAKHAFVFDAMDASLAKTLHVVNLLASAQGYRRVLLVRAENTVHLDPCNQSGFEIANGVMAMLLTPDPTQSFFSEAIQWQGQPLRVNLAKHIQDAHSAKGQFVLPHAPALAQEINRSVDKILSNPAFSGTTPIIESWLSDSPESGVCEGPFGIPNDLAQRPSDAGRFQLVSVDLFSMQVDTVTLKWAQERSHA